MNVRSGRFLLLIAIFTLTFASPLIIGLGTTVQATHPGCGDDDDDDDCKEAYDRWQSGGYPQSEWEDDPWCWWMKRVIECPTCPPPPPDPPNDPEDPNDPNGDQGEGGSDKPTDKEPADDETYNGNRSGCKGGCDESIYTDRGEERYEVTDLRVPGVGFDWEHKRIYRSATSAGSPMGEKWWHGHHDWMFVARIYASGDWDPTTGKWYRAFAYGGSNPGEVARTDQIDLYDSFVADVDPPPGYELLQVGVPEKGFYASLRVYRAEGETVTDGSKDIFVVVSRSGWKRTYKTRQLIGISTQVAEKKIAGRVYIDTLEDPHGNTMRFHYDDSKRPTRLTQVEDTRGEFHTYVYYDREHGSPPNDSQYRQTSQGSTAITNLPLVHGKLAYVQDSTNRRVTYFYDDEGNLIEARGPEVTPSDGGSNYHRTEKYTYASTDPADPVYPHTHHLLTGVIKPNEINGEDAGYSTWEVDPNDSNSESEISNGTPTLEWEYYNSGRVKSHTVGGEKIHYSYHQGISVPNFVSIPFQLPSDYDPSLESKPVFRTTEIDRNGVKRRYFFNAKSYGRRTRLEVYAGPPATPGGEPTALVTRYLYDDEGRLELETHPSGLQYVYEYDDNDGGSDRKANILVKETRLQQGVALTHPIDGSPIADDQATLVEKFAYDPFYNKPMVHVDPRGNDATYTPLIPAAVSGPERYATIYSFDYQERSPADLTALSNKFLYGDSFITARVTASVENARKALGQAPLGATDPLPEIFLNQDLNGDQINPNQIGGRQVKVQRPGVHPVAGLEEDTRLGAADSQTIETLHGFNQYGQKTFDVDPNGVVTTYTYFTSGHEAHFLEKTVVDASSGGPSSSFIQRRPSTTEAPYADITTLYTRDERNNPLTVLDGRGNTTTYTYDELDRVVSQTTPSPYDIETVYTYDPNGRMVEERVTHRRAELTTAGKPKFDSTNPLNVELEDPTHSSSVDLVHKYYYDLNDNLLLEDLDASPSSGSALRIQTRHRYDDDENRILTILPNGNKVAYEYDERSLLVRTTHAPGQPEEAVTANAYDITGNLIQSVDGEEHGSQNSIILTPSGTVTGDLTTFVYDRFNRLKETIDPLGNRTVHRYDPASQIVETAFYGHPPAATPNNNSGTGNQLFQLTRFWHDELGRVFRTDRWLGGDDALLDSLDVSTYQANQWDDAAPTFYGNPLRPSDDFVTTFTEYDASGNVTFTHDEDADTTALLYDGLGRLIRTDDPSGSRVELVYDENANVVEKRAYDFDQDTATLETTPQVTTYGYDVLNRKTRVTDFDNNTFRFAHDSMGNLAVAEDARGNTTRHEHDGLGRKLATHVDLRVGGTGLDTGSGVPALDTNEGGGDGVITTQWAYDASSNLVAITDDNHNQTFYQYDARDRRVTATYGVTKADPDANNITPNVASTLPPTTDSLTSGTNPDPPTTEAWAYDDDNNVTTYTDQNGSTHAFTYDALHRRTQAVVTPAAGNPHGLYTPDGQPHSVKQLFLYDGLGRVFVAIEADVVDTGMIAGQGAVLCTYTYDALSRVLTESQAVGQLPSLDIARAYDFAAIPLAFDDPALGDGSGNLAPTSLTYADGRVVHLGYDNAGRLNALADDGHVNDPIATYRYDGPGARLVKSTLGNGLTATYTHDHLDRLQTLRVDPTPPGGGSGGGSGGPLFHVDYAYNAAYNPVVEDNLVLTDRSRTYTYDSADRLKAFNRGTLDINGAKISPGNHTTHPAFRQAEGYALDGLGNWNAHLDLRGHGLLQETRTHTNFNEIDTRDDGAGPAPALVYDDNGNLRDDGALAYTWDALNRLRLVRDTTRAGDPVIARYAYDTDSRRVLRRVQNGGVANDAQYNGETRFTYLGQRNLDEYKVDHATGQSIRLQHVYGPRGLDHAVVNDDRNGVGVSALNNGSGKQRRYLHQDRQLSVRMVTDEGGAVNARYDYDPHGQHYMMPADGLTVLNWDATNQDWFAKAGRVRFGYTGQRYDVETGLWHFKKRYLHPELGRFVSRDPAGYVDGMSLYMAYFVATGIDPLGLQRSWLEAARDFVLGKPHRPAENSRSRTISELTGDPEPAARQQRNINQMNQVTDGIATTPIAVAETITPDPTVAVDGVQAIGTAATSPDLTMGERGQLAVAGVGLVASGALDTVDIVPDPSDAAQKAANRGLKEKVAEIVENSQRHSAEKQALIEMAKRDKRTGITPGDMQAYKDLNADLPDPFPADKVRGPEAHPNRGEHAQQPHGHVGPVDHIPIREEGCPSK